MNAVPLTAWEQGAFVVLYAILTVTLLGGLYAFTRALLKQMQDYVAKRDTDWQEYFVKRELAFDARNGAVVRALEDLSTTTREHDERMMIAIETMKERTQTRTRRSAHTS